MTASSRRRSRRSWSEPTNRGDPGLSSPLPPQQISIGDVASASSILVCQGDGDDIFLVLRTSREHFHDHEIFRRHHGHVHVLDDPFDDAIDEAIFESGPASTTSSGSNVGSRTNGITRVLCRNPAS